MSYFFSLLILITAATSLGCASTLPPREQFAARPFDFPVRGQLASISTSDLATIVKVMQPIKIHRMHIIDHNEVVIGDGSDWSIVGGRRVHTESFTPRYAVRRIHGVWQLDELMFTIGREVPPLPNHALQRTEAGGQLFLYSELAFASLCR